MQSSELTEREQLRRGDLGSRIADGRRVAGLTQRQLAERLRVTLDRIARLEDGRADALPLLARIAEALGKSPEWFGVAASELAGEALAPRASEQPHEAERMRPRIAELEEELAQRASTGTRIGVLETKLRATEEQLLERDRRIAELSAQLDLIAQGHEAYTSAGNGADAREPRVAALTAPAERDARQTYGDTPRLPQVGAWDPLHELRDDHGNRNAPEDEEHELRPAAAAQLLPVAVRASRHRRSPLRAVMAVLGAVAALILLGVLAFALLHRADARLPRNAAPSPTLSAAEPRVKGTRNLPQAPVARKAAVPARPGRTRTVHATLPPAKTAVLVLNGNRVAGAAAREALLVKRLGYRVSGVTNARRQDYARSIVMYRHGLRTEALKLARKLRVPVVSPLQGLGLSNLGRTKLVIILGRR